jgi:hypothetical protein
MRVQSLGKTMVCFTVLTHKFLYLSTIGFNGTITEAEVGEIKGGGRFGAYCTYELLILFVVKKPLEGTDTLGHCRPHSGPRTPM